jgi:hypothetical protein
MLCEFCKEGSSATDSVTDVTDVTDVMDVSSMSVGRRKIEEGMGVNLTSNVLPIYCLTMIAPIPRSSGGTGALFCVPLLNGNATGIETCVKTRFLKGFRRLLIPMGTGSGAFFVRSISNIATALARLTFSHCQALFFLSNADRN